MTERVYYQFKEFPEGVLRVSCHKSITSAHRNSLIFSPFLFVSLLLASLIVLARVSITVIKHHDHGRKGLILAYNSIPQSITEGNQGGKLEAGADTEECSSWLIWHTFFF